MNWVDLILGLLDRAGIYKRRNRSSKSKKELDKLKEKRDNDSKK